MIPIQPPPPAGTATAFDRLPLPLTDEGAARRVGVEVEFTGISARTAAQALAAELGGNLAEEDPHAFHVAGTPLGRLTVELDLRDAHPQRHRALPRIRLGATGAAWLGSALSGMVPRELITGPIEIDSLPEVDRILQTLRRAGAHGWGSTLFGSLGLHFNVDPPGRDASTVTATLKAYLLLEPWLRSETLAGGSSTSFLPAPFPPGYVRQVVAPEYQPDLATLTQDYLAANPTRDRGLDLLPLFLCMNESLVRSRLPYEKIGGRAVYHYRLPRAHVGEPGWSIAPAWNRWVAVEALAHDRSRLDAMARDFLREADRH